jgi:hypothetical protein
LIELLDNRKTIYWRRNSCLFSILITRTVLWSWWILCSV